MIKKLLAVLAVALTAMLMVPTDQAEARHGGGGGGGFHGGGGGGFRGGGGGGGFRAAPMMRAPAFRAAPVYRSGPIYRAPIYRPVRVSRRIYSPVYIAGGGCEWLRRRALVTGSAYWWRRYRYCRGW